ncbi:helix-turn-helix transcriptional regulator [Proteiniclasticum sp. SCR006]|uniref:Helix-turn-helix transcriptional regulator n=1 Tax=Proteiniclasticum aestuarii TaxID=2817862 RepID=A0A939KJM5_9CLOT|nr:helix-turn-helix transcriptional regulator [Proteiniclasticum aestuarii]MBO1265318.1 helix-turn-helix transcriptional regulator [Proteiniclasticum aestuarii]
MFISYNLLEFGEKLKELRKSLGYSQVEIQKLAGVSSDGLRRIEKGEVIPRYETLELLSSIYKEDLLELLKNARSNKLLTEYHDELDDIITCYDDQKMKKLEEDIRLGFTGKNESSIVNPNEVIQFLLLIRGASLYHSRFASDHKDARNILQDALKLTIPAFRLEDYKEYKYSYIELRILLLLSILIAEDQEVALSTKILYFILDRLKTSTTSKYQDFLIIKIYTNISYNYHLEDNHKRVIKVANEGIAYCLSRELTHALNSLYYRKGIAEYKLRHKTYKSSLFSAFFILKMTGKEELLDIYLDVTEEQYGIEFPTEFLKSK